MKMSKFEKKFGKYAIQNLTFYLIMCYVIGYAIQLFPVGNYLIGKLTLDPNAVLHGEVWRLVSWLLIPPSTVSIKQPFSILFVLIMLYFYYSIGTTLERTWGAYRYNVYLFTGVLITILSSFAYLGYLNLFGAELGVALDCAYFSTCFSTYYISLSIFLAFAATYPDMQVLLMFAIPIKVKWLGILDIVLLIYDLLFSVPARKFVVAAALINFVIFYLTTRSLFHMSPKQIKRRAEFKTEVKRNTKITRHKCAICGRTEEDAPELEFRFCSKCNGNYEYCQNHLFTHEHVK